MRTVTTPRPGRWHLVPEQADVAFAGRATRLSPVVRARFLDVTGVLACGDAEAVEVQIDVRSMTAGNRAWDELVAQLDPFDAARHPVARYRSTAVRWSGGTAQVEGRLELRGVVRPVALRVTHDVEADGTRLRLRAHGEIDREAFGVRCDLPGAALLVPRRLQLAIDVVAVHEHELAVAA